MNPKYHIGQKVILRSIENSTDVFRDSTLEQYTDHIGQVTNYYWISPSPGEIFFIYTVRFEPDNKEIVLHEDEIKLYHR